MSSREVLEYLKAQPFRPFRIVMNSGRSFDIRHPEMIRVGRDHLILFSYVCDDADVVDRWETVSLLLVEMITVQRLATYVGAEPFRPFRIRMTSGQVLEIRHPEMISVGRSSAHIFTFMSEDPEEANQREFDISLLLIESGSNGARIRRAFPAVASPYCQWSHICNSSSGICQDGAKHIDDLRSARGGSRWSTTLGGNLLRCDRIDCPP